MEEAFDGRIPKLMRTLPDAQAAVTTNALTALETDLRESLTDLPEQMIHRDCHPANVLVEGRRVVGFIDCDHLSVGSPVLDIAYFLIHLIKWDAEDLTRRAEWLEELPVFLRGYVSRHPLSERERNALPCMFICVLLMFAEHFRGQGEWDAVQVELTALSFVLADFETIRHHSSP